MKYASDFSAQRPRECLIFLKISIKWSFCVSVSEMKLFMIKDIYIYICLTSLTRAKPKDTMAFPT